MINSISNHVSHSFDLIGSFQARVAQSRYDTDSVFKSQPLKDATTEFMKLCERKAQYKAWAPLFIQCLMGEKHAFHLPDELANLLEKWSDVSNLEMQDSLKSLFQTNRFGIFKESPEKSFQKIAYLQKNIYTHKDAFKSCGFSDETTKIVLEKMNEADKNGGKLDLSGLNLHCIPPIPNDLAMTLTKLDLSNNTITSLAGLPSNMWSMKVLNMSKNHLTSLHGWQNIDSLKEIDFSDNEIHSLHELKTHLIDFIRPKFDLKKNPLSNLKDDIKGLTEQKFVQLREMVIIDDGWPARDSSHDRTRDGL